MDTIRNRVGEVYEPFKVRFLEREIHALADDEVLVRVRASAICGAICTSQEGCILPLRFR